MRMYSISTNKIIRLLSNLLTGVYLVALLTSCSKFLDEKPDKATATIQTIGDLQALLDQTDIYSSLPTAASDEYYLTSDAFNAKSQEARNTYTWVEAIADNWSYPYTSVYSANVVMEEIKKISGTDEEKRIIKGQALFKRAFAFFQVAQIYCRPYSESAATDLGIPLRLLPDVELKSYRSTVKETYDRITQDLKEAVELLPLSESANNRPDKTNTYGLLARVYLSMRDYGSAKVFADLYLQHYRELIDYNTLDTIADPAFDKFHIENSFFAQVDGIIPDYDAIIDTSLYESYEPGDLRKAIFFRINDDGSIRFKGNYGGGTGYIPYAGIATDEIYLIRAECNARSGHVEAAVADINTLLVKRWKSGEFVPRIVIGKEEAIHLVLNERRKELVFRGTRWTDLRRLNLEGANKSLTRRIGTSTYTLPPNDKRWVWLIPREVIAATDMEQNER